MVSEFLLGELGYTLSLYSIGNGKAWTYIVNVQCTHTLMYCTVQYLVGEHWFEVAQKSKVALPRKERDQGENSSPWRETMISWLPLWQLLCLQIAKGPASMSGYRSSDTAVNPSSIFCSS